MQDVTLITQTGVIWLFYRNTYLLVCIIKKGNCLIHNWNDFLLWSATVPTVQTTQCQDPFENIITKISEICFGKLCSTKLEPHSLKIYPTDIWARNGSAPISIFYRSKQHRFIKLHRGWLQKKSCGTLFHENQILSLFKRKPVTCPCLRGKTTASKLERNYHR